MASVARLTDVGCCLVPNAVSYASWYLRGTVDFSLHHKLQFCVIKTKFL